MSTTHRTTLTILRRAGDRGWLADLEGADIAATVRALSSGPLVRLIDDIVPTAESVLVIARDGADMPVLAEGIREVLRQAHARTKYSAARTVVIPVCYDGPDLDAVADRLGLGRDDVIAAHSEAQYRVGFFGFAPGFAYIDGLPAHLDLPRLSTPRARVPAGTVAIAGLQSVVYPGGTPGGWHLIGSTPEVLWDIDCTPPNRLNLGDHVVFEMIDR
ncbi:5-oxoprolinase subunit B family protein [Rhodococcus sp. NPDC055024]